MPSSTRRVTPDKVASTDSGSSVGRPRPSESPSHIPGNPASSVRRARSLIRSISPLPSALDSLRPTTGYEDVKSVALARLAAPNIPDVQVDWLRYGPKLAQVALTFGANDVDNVQGSDDAPDGRRRAPLEEVRRNIQAAGFEAAERDGRFALIG